MSKIKIEIKGVAAELSLGNYMPSDMTIVKNWEDFYHYNDLIHVSQLMTNHISEITISSDEDILFKGKIPASAFTPQKSYCPVMENSALYLRTECAENAVFMAEFETDHFNKNFLRFETQDYDCLFKLNQSFITSISYKNEPLELNWQSGTPIGNLCLLCKFENGYLVPVYDAIKKTNI